MAEVGRVIWSNLLLKKSHVEHVVQDCIHMASEYLQQWKLHILSWQPVQCSVTLTVKICFLMFRRSLLCFSLCLLLLVLSTRSRNLSLSSYSHHQVLAHIAKVPLNLSSRLNNPSSLDLSSKERCSSPRTDDLQVIFVTFPWSPPSMSLVLGSPALDPALQVWLHQCYVEQKDHLPKPAGST